MYHKHTVFIKTNQMELGLQPYRTLAKTDKVFEQSSHLNSSQLSNVLNWKSYSKFKKVKDFVFITSPAKTPPLEGQFPLASHQSSFLTQALACPHFMYSLSPRLHDCLNGVTMSDSFLNVAVWCGGTFK